VFATFEQLYLGNHSELGTYSYENFFLSAMTDTHIHLFLQNHPVYRILYSGINKMTTLFIHDESKIKADE